MPDSAHINPRPEFEGEPSVTRARTPEAAPAPKSKKDELFTSSEAVNFEKQTIANFDNQNIARSQVPDSHLPDVDSNFPSSEQTMPLPELDDHEYR
jgi:hypothetical protein